MNRLTTGMLLVLAALAIQGCGGGKPEENPSATPASAAPSVAATTAAPSPGASASATPAGTGTTEPEPSLTGTPAEVPAPMELPAVTDAGGASEGQLHQQATDATDAATQTYEEPLTGVPAVAPAQPGEVEKTPENPWASSEPGSPVTTPPGPVSTAPEQPDFAAPLPPEPSAASPAPSPSAP